MGKTLLGPNALRGCRLAISVSESEDLERLGLLEAHFRVALAEITRCVLVAGGELAYGGHLRSDGYTAFIMSELGRYSRRNKPFKSYLAWTVHRGAKLSELSETAKTLSLLGEIICLDPDGKVVRVGDGRSEAAESFSAEMSRQSLTSLRSHMADHTHGRVFLGGKRAGFTGVMPGLLEETICSLERGQPVYLAGGFGGATADIAREFGVLDYGWLPKLPSTATDDRFAHALVKLREVIAKAGSALNNGLNPDENRRLAITHRPCEIAALIGLGMGRRFRQPTPPAK